jgi:hypothetical protein
MRPVSHSKEAILRHDASVLVTNPRPFQHLRNDDQLSWAETENIVMTLFRRMARIILRVALPKHRQHRLLS